MCLLVQSVWMGFTWWTTLHQSLWDSLPCWWTAASVGAFSVETGMNVTLVHHLFALITRTQFRYHSLLRLQPRLALHAALQLLVYELSRLLGWFNPLLHLQSVTHTLAQCRRSFMAQNPVQANSVKHPARLGTLAHACLIIESFTCVTYHIGKHIWFHVGNVSHYF